MAERSTLLQTTQIGVEALLTPGTAVAANRQLQSVQIAPSIDPTIDRFRPQGQKFDALAIVNREQVGAPISGRMTYTEIIYLLASALTNPTTVTASGATTWTFAPSSSAEDAPRTFTVESGGTVRAHRFSYGIVTELTVDISRDAVELGGNMLGRSIEDGITMTATPTLLPLTPVLGTEWNCYLDPTAAALGTTKLGRVLKASWGFGGRFGPVYVLDRAQGLNFAATVETEPDATFTLLVEADAEGMALLDDMRAGVSNFLRLEAEGPVIGAGPATNRIRFDFAGKIDDVADFSDEDGVFAVGWQFRMVHDATWGKALQAEVRNAVAAL